jgi:hypothetical protein
MYLFYKYILYFRNNNVLKINDTLWAIFWLVVNIGIAFFFI